MKFIVMSDLHYISPEMIIDDKKASINSAVTIQSLLDAAAYRDIDTILITGDLTDKGDKPSHLALVRMLRKLKENGKKVYVTTATHDFNHNRAYTRKRGDTNSKFETQPWDKAYFNVDNADFSQYMAPESLMDPNRADPQLVECFSPSELWDLYHEFGRDDAISVENSSYSYCIDLDDKTRCLMLNDNFRNEEALHDISVTYSPACFKWIEKMVKQAKDDGKFIFACTHHPLLPPSPAYRIGAGNRDMRSPYSAHTLADIGINLVFTGHSHFSDVGFAQSDLGNNLCDITTPSVRFYPPRFRLVKLDGLNGRIAYRCVDVSVPKNSGIRDESLASYYRKEMYNEYLVKMQNLKNPLNKIVTEMTVKNFYFLCRSVSKLTAEEYEKVKNLRFFDLVMNAVFNMLAGDGKYTPDTPEYKVLMGLATVLDSIADTQPFADVRKKFLKGYSVSDIIKPLCFNNFVSDNEAEFDFTVRPAIRKPTIDYKSHAGDILMVIICILVIPLSIFLPAIAIVGVPALTISKKIQNKKNPPKPYYRY